MSALLPTDELRQSRERLTREVRQARIAEQRGGRAYLPGTSSSTLGAVHKLRDRFQGGGGLASCHGPIPNTW